MRAAYILPISPMPMIPTVMLFSVFIGITAEDFVEADMILTKPIFRDRLDDECAMTHVESVGCEVWTGNSKHVGGDSDPKYSHASQNFQTA